MTKCPNCGSSAQFKLSTPIHFVDGAWKQQKKCGCGCVVVLRYTEEIDKIEYPEDTGNISPLAHAMIKTMNERKEMKK